MKVQSPVLLKWGKRPKGSNKHSPLLAIEPETGKPVNYGKPLSRADFNGSSIDSLMAENNFVVQTSKDWSVGISVDYCRFLELGLRHAQQLDGKFREKTVDLFDASYERLKAALISQVLEVRKQRRATVLESLLESTDGMPAEDVERLKGYVAALRSVPIATHEEPDSMMLSPKLQQRISRLWDDQSRDSRFIENCLLVAPELRADYVRAVEVIELTNNDTIRSIHENSEEIREYVCGLGAELGRLYLKVLYSGVAYLSRDMHLHMAKIQEAKQQLSNTHGAEYLGRAFERNLWALAQ